MFSAGRFSGWFKMKSVTCLRKMMTETVVIEHRIRYADHKVATTSSVKANSLAAEMMTHCLLTCQFNLSIKLAMTVATHERTEEQTAVNIHAVLLLFMMHITVQSGFVAAQQIDSLAALIPTVCQGEVVGSRVCVCVWRESWGVT